jgi:tetratricopeptide (TPR) repeat protein
MRALLVRVALVVLSASPAVRADSVGRFPEVSSRTAPAPKMSGSNELVSRGARHEAAGRYADAVAAYTEAAKLDPSNGQALLALGRLRVKMNDTHEAEEVFSAAAKLVDVEGQALRERARLEHARGRDEDAVRDLESAVALVPEETAWAEELAAWYVARRAWLPALAVYRRLAVDVRGTPLQRHAALEIRALRILSGDLDPVFRGRAPENTFVRRALARLSDR